MIKMIKAEVQNLFHNHILLLSISVICLLPFLMTLYIMNILRNILFIRHG